MACKREIEIYIQLYPVNEPGAGYTSATLVTTGKRYKVNLDYFSSSIIEAYSKGLINAISKLDKPTIIKFHCDDIMFMSQLLQISTLGIGEDTERLYRQYYQALIAAIRNHKLCLNAQHNDYFERIASNEAARIASELEEISTLNIMAFATEQEAIEIAKINSWKIIDLIVKGSEVILYYKTTKADTIAKVSEVKYIVCTTTPNSTIYVSKDGKYTFNQSEAKRMSLGEAKAKAAGMTRASRKGYRWNALKV